MKKIIGISTFVIMIFSLLAFAPGGKKTGLISGKDAFLKKSVTIFVEFDISKSSIDGLDTEEGFIQYHKEKKKNPEDAKKWEDGWKKDKASFGEFYVEYLRKKLKKAPATFNLDDPKSDYKMIVEPMHIETGTPIKYSSFETKLKFIETASGEEVAVIYIPGVRGQQQGPMSPTTGMRVKYSIMLSANMFIGYYKKKLK